MSVWKPSATGGIVGVGVDMRVGVLVGRGVSVMVGVWVAGAGEGVSVGVRVRVGVRIGVAVTVRVRVTVGVRVGVPVRVGVSVGLNGPPEQEFPPSPYTQRAASESSVPSDVPRNWTDERIWAAPSSPRQTSCGAAPWSAWPNPRVCPNSWVTMAAKMFEERQVGPVIWRTCTWPELIVQYDSPRQVCVPPMPDGPPHPATPPPQKGPVMPQRSSEPSSMKLVPELAVLPEE
jgi:hypothetical protein